MEPPPSPEVFFSVIAFVARDILKHLSLHHAKNAAQILTRTLEASGHVRNAQMIQFL
jgi:hypothetical protein